MPTYTFKRPDGSLMAKRLNFSEYESLKSGEMKLVDQDDAELELVFNPGDVNFVLKNPAGAEADSRVALSSPVRSFIEALDLSGL